MIGLFFLVFVHFEHSDIFRQVVQFMLRVGVVFCTVGIKYLFE